MKRFIYLTLLLCAALVLSAQQYSSSTGRSYDISVVSSGNAGAVSATTLFTPPATGFYVIDWDLTTTVTSTAGTMAALTFAWNNGNAMSRNTLLMGPQLLDLTSLTSTGLTGAEIGGTQVIYCGTTGAVTWATVVGTTIVGSPTYTARFRVRARN
jgi:hypothetical protein